MTLVLLHLRACSYAGLCVNREGGSDTFAFAGRLYKKLRLPGVVGKKGIRKRGGWCRVVWLGDAMMNSTAPATARA
jgi:CO dehydrogenase/acetyl-CoA synthase beta subunit